MSESLYLQNLRFDERLKNSFVARYLSNTRLILLIIMCLIVAGAFSFANLPRQLNPDVDLAIVNVVTTLPGAAPLDVENLVTEKIEKELSSLTDVDIMSSQSQESVSVVTVQFLGNKDSDKALDEVRQKVDLVSDLPDNATDPVVQKLDFNDQPVWQVALTSPNTDPLSLTKIAQELEDKIEDESGIRKVDLIGAETEEIVIELDRSSLSELNITSSSILQALRSNDLSFPAGRVTVHDTQYTLTIDNELTSIQQLRQLPLTIGNEHIPLAQIAHIYLRSQETATPIVFRTNGQRSNAVELAVYKTDAETIDGAYQKAKKVIDAELANYEHIRSYDVFNFAKDTNQSFNELQSSFINSVLFVLVALTLFLGFRQALIAAISLPLTLMCTFIIMGISGVTLSFLAVFSLLLAISLIGDDAIVIVQSSRQYQKHFKPLEAGLLVWRDFFIPIWTGTLTVVWSFVPLLLASGIIGKFIRPIPIVVSATLLSSTAIATLINLPLNILLAELHVPKRLRVLLVFLGTVATMGALYVIVNRSPFAVIALILYILLLIVGYFNRSFIGQTVRNSGKLIGKRFPRLQRLGNWIQKRDLLSKPLIDLGPLANRYQQAIEPIIRKKRSRWMVYGILVGLLVLSGIFLGTGLLKNEFFPKTDSNLLFVNVEGPAGWTKEKTDQVMRLVEDKLDQVPEIEHSFIQLGAQASGGFGGGGGGNNTASATLTLVDKEDRDRTSSEISEVLRKELEQITEANVTVQEESGGPPAGSDFQANIKGENLDVLEQISQEFMKKLSEIEGVANIESSLKLSAGQIHVDLIPAELAKRNLSAAQVGDWLRTAVTGQDSGDIVINDEDIDILLTIDEQNRTLSYLQNLVLPSQMGQYTLGDIAKFNLEQSPSSITREDGKRVVRVNASAVSPQTAPEMLKAFNEKIKEYELPEGYTWDVGGANEENQKSVNSILQAMVISFTLILVTMVLLLNSFRQALIVLVVIPLSVAGVFINFTIFGIPLSFPALIGVLALFGIVVNNALMLMDKINQNMHEGFPVYKGVADACASRIEPIFLTAITGILGLLPITISDPLWRGLGGAIVAGLSVSGILVLFLIPSLYVEVFGKQLLKKEKQ